jgi:hypothetical protein
MKSYIAIVSMTTSLVLLAAAVINYLVDPLLLYRYPVTDVEMLNRIDQFNNVRFYKLGHINRLRPDAVILGSSRTANMRPDHPGWKNNKAYNLSVPGLRIYEMLQFAAHANSNRHLDKLVLGLDFNSFIISEPLFQAGFVQQRIASTADDVESLAYRLQQIKDIQSTLFSLNMLGLSTSALSHSNSKIRWFKGDGSWESTSTSMTGRGGYSFVAGNFISHNSRRHFDARANLNLFRDLLRFCYHNNIETRLFFTPIHVFFVDFWHQFASRDLWRQVHLDIVNINRDVAAEYDREPFSLHGFGNIDGVNNEPIYRRKDVEKAWFNDGIHFRANLADNIMRALWDESSNFGQSLTFDNLDAYLNEIELMKDVFLMENRELVSKLQSKYSTE